MQYARNSLIMHLTNGLKNNIAKNNFIPKNMINLKINRGPPSKLPLSRARIRKFPVHMTRVVKIDIITGYEGKGCLHFIL